MLFYLLFTFIFMSPHKVYKTVATVLPLSEKVKTKNTQLKQL